MHYEPLYHKYRPQSFAELVGQDAISQTLSNALNQQRIAHAYLFTGPRGTGKSSSARILAKSLNCIKGDAPTDSPCGVCDICRSITQGNSLDVIEIDAASNTGVDNIRELIERSQFAPAQCRYKVYVVDECLTGDTLVLSHIGPIRIDDPSLLGKSVLSYNDISRVWEFKPVVRWLDQGECQTLIIKTAQREIRCTGNHLIRTDQGWIAAQDISNGMKILSPANVDAAISFASPAAIVGSTKRLENGLSAFRSTRSQVWRTNLEIVKSVNLGGIESVYDIEVEDNHNFVANGLLVHNCHMLSTAAFNALLKTLEEPPPRVVFVLATTDPQRVLPTIISRCQRFDFRRIPLEAMVAHLVAIATKEKISIEPAAVQLVGQLAQGGLRDAESLLDQLSLLPTTITPEAVWDLVGAVPEQSLLQLVQVIHHGSPEQILDCARELMDRGREPLIVLQNLASFYRDMLIAKTAPDRADLVAITAQTWQQLCEFVQSLDIELLLRGQQHLRSSEVQVKNTTQPRLWLEITLLGLIPSALTPASVPSLQNIRNFNITPPAVTASPRPAVTPDHPVAIAPPITTASAVVAPPVQPTSDHQQPSPAKPDSAPTPVVTPVVVPVVAETPIPRSTPSSTEISTPVVITPEIPQPSSPTETVAPAVVPSASSEFLPPELDLTETWNQVIAHIQPALTQVLARQQCRLLGFRGSQARVGVKTQALLKIAQSKLPNFEAAFQTVFQRLVKVTVEVIASDPVSTPSPAAPTVITTPAYIPQTFGNLVTPQTPNVPTQPPALPSQPIPANPTQSHPLPSDALLPPRPETQVTAPAPLVTESSQTAGIAHPASPPTIPQEVAPPAPSTPAIPLAADAVTASPVEVAPAWTPPDELDRAVRSLAELFRGQIVSLEPGESGQELEIGRDGFTWDAGASDLDD